MRRILIASGLALAVAASTTAADARSRCETYAHNRKVTGTVVGAIGGGLLGNAVAGHGSKGAGTLIGAGLGAVVGNNLARVSCDGAPSHHRRHARASSVERRSTTLASASCRMETRPYYDAAGRLVYAPVRVCD
jgi:uncharacterized protein YcfJ